MAIAVLDVFTRAVSWTTGMVEGLFHGLMGPGEGALRSRGEGARFVQLHRAILGRRREDVVVRLGAPSAVGVDSGTWYYRLDEAGRQAIAIWFVGDRVRGMELIGSLSRVTAEPAEG